jgi:hypothetical protein
MYQSSPLAAGMIRIREIVPETPFMKMFASFEKKGWSTTLRRINRRRPQLNQKSCRTKVNDPVAIRPTMNSKKSERAKNDNR